MDTRTAWVYIMASATRTTYIGVTNDLERRVWEHKTHYDPESFMTKYEVTNFVYIEEYSRFDDAIAREKSLKGISRAKKLKLIAGQNPRWNDLAWTWFGEEDIARDRRQNARDRQPQP